MMPSDAAVLLTKISAFDQRTIGEADAAAWAEIMTDAEIALDDVLPLVTDHYRTSHNRLMPVDLISAVRRVRAARLADAINAVNGHIPIPGDLDQAQERAWRQLWVEAAKAGDPDPVKVANHALGIRPLELELTPMPVEVRERIVGFVRQHAVPQVKS